MRAVNCHLCPRTFVTYVSGLYTQAKTKSPGAILNSRRRTRRANAMDGVRKVTRSARAKKRFAVTDTKSVNNILFEFKIKQTSAVKEIQNENRYPTL